MKYFKSENMIRGWFVGDFEPTVYKTEACEVAVKTYKVGDYEKSHHHKKATEISQVISGKVKMKSIILKEGDIVIISPNESTDFEALTDARIVVVKIPGAKNDKYVKN